MCGDEQTAAIHLGGITICVTSWVARYSRVHIPQPRTRKASLLDWNVPDADWYIVYKKAIHLLPCTFQPKPMHHLFKCHAPFNNLVSYPDYFSGTRLQGDICMLDLSFSTYYDVAKLHLVAMWRINQPHYLGNIQECCSSLTSAVYTRKPYCLGNRLHSSYVSPWGVLLHFGG